MNSTAQMCLVCETPLDPDEDVIWAIQDSYDHVGGRDVQVKRTGYAHVDEDAQVMALGGWTVMGRGRLRDLTSRDVQESSDRL
jgi:hypothetical protein